MKNLCSQKFAHVGSAVRHVPTIVTQNLQMAPYRKVYDISFFCSNNSLSNSPLIQYNRMF